MFPKTYENYNRIIDENELVIIDGRLSISEVEEPKIICEKIMPLSKYKLSKVYIKITKDKNNDIFNKINPILKKSAGDTPIYIYLESTKQTLVADRSLWINPDDQEVIDDLEILLGKNNVVFS